MDGAVLLDTGLGLREAQLGSQSNAWVTLLAYQALLGRVEWLSRPRSSSEVSEPGSRALMGWWTETWAREALSLLGRQGDWAFAESLQVIHSASRISSQCPCGPVGTAVDLKET